MTAISPRVKLKTSWTLVLVLGDAGVATDGAGEALGFEAVEGLADFDPRRGR
jgi:hypothetical protein